MPEPEPWVTRKPKISRERHRCYQKPQGPDPEVTFVLSQSVSTQKNPTIHEISNINHFETAFLSPFQGSIRLGEDSVTPGSTEPSVRYHLGLICFDLSSY